MARKAPPSALLRNRTARLLPPLVFGMLVIVPPQSYLQVVQKFGYAGSFTDFYAAHYFAFAPQFCDRGHCILMPTWNHLWFVAYLLVYTAILALLLAMAPRLIRSIERRLAPVLSGPLLLLLPALALAAYRIWLQPVFPQTNALIGDWYNHALYATMFAFGYLFALDEGVAAAAQRLRRPALIAAIIGYGAFMASWVLRQGSAPSAEALAVLGLIAYGVFQWSAILAILGFGRLWLTRDMPARRYLTDAVFPYYIVHQTAIILTAHWLREADLPAAAEAAIVIAVTLASCALTYEIVRRVRWLRPLFGLKILSPSAASGEQHLAVRAVSGSPVTISADNR
jgi:hypothetical protein